MTKAADPVLPSVEVLRTRLTKWDGDVPEEYLGVDVDPDNPPPGVKEIIEVDYQRGGAARVLYRRN